MCFISPGRGPGPRVRPPTPTGQPRSVTRNTPLPTGRLNPLSAADWSVLRPLRDAQHRAADWSTTPYCMISSRLAPARRRRRPAHPRPPSQLASPPLPCRRSPEGEPLWHHRATRGLPWRGLSPRSEALDRPRTGRRSAQQAPRHRHAAVEPLP